MLDVLERHIRSHAPSWGLALEDRIRLSVLVRANPEHDGVVEEFGGARVGTVLFWFRAGEVAPFLVTKVSAASIPSEAILRCDELHRHANGVIGYRLFPSLYEVLELQGSVVLFMEAIDGPNFDVELARAVSGPERSSAALRRVWERQLGELGKALRDLRRVGLSEEPVRWGEAALRYAEDFFALCPQAREAFGEARLARMGALVDSMPLEVHLVLTEDHIANYLPGPRAVDQIVPDLDALCAAWPGPVAGLRLLLAIFRASALREAFSTYRWVDALASATVSEREHPVLGAPVRRFLDDLGLKGVRPDVLWALLTGVFFLRGWQELRFHGRNGPLEEKLRAEYLGYTARFAAIADGVAAPDTLRIQAPILDRKALDEEHADRDAPSFMSPERVFQDPREARSAPLVRALRVALAPYPALRRAARGAYRLVKGGRHQPD